MKYIPMLERWSFDEYDESFFSSGFVKALPTSWRPWVGFEERMNEAVQVFLTNQLASIRMKMISDQAIDAALESAFWAVQTQLMQVIFQTIFEDLVKFAIDQVSSTVSGIEVDWGLVNQDAVNWSKEFAADRVKAITETTRLQIGEIVSDGLTNGWGIDEIADAISKSTGFSESRSEVIAITEVTTAFAEANERAWVAAGYAPARFKPSAHPRCRCRLQPHTMPDGTKVLVWHTARDERVCTEPIDTPWRVVKGCKELHRMVVSDGQFLGQSLP